MGFLTNVYGPPRAEQKVQFLDSLRMLHSLSEDKPWITRGDFNLIISMEEKKGRIREINPIFEMFNEVIDNLNLVDVRTTNGNFTWNNKRTGDRGIACRTDIFLVSESVIMNEG